MGGQLGRGVLEGRWEANGCVGGWVVSWWAVGSGQEGRRGRKHC